MHMLSWYNIIAKNVDFFSFSFSFGFIVQLLTWANTSDYQLASDGKIAIWPHNYTCQIICRLSVFSSRLQFTAPFRHLETLRSSSDYQFSIRWQDSWLAGWPPNVDEHLVINTWQIIFSLSVFLFTSRHLFRLQFIAPFRQWDTCTDFKKWYYQFSFRWQDLNS